MSRYERIEYDENGDDIRLYSRLDRQWSANVQFRVYTPMEALNNSQLGVCYPHVTLPPPIGEVDDVPLQRWKSDQNQGLLAGSHSNAWLFPNANSDVLLERMNEMRKECRERGRKPMLFIYDAEDLNTHVYPLNAAFRWLGTRDFDGNELKDGDELFHTSPVTGVKRRIVKVGETKDFDLETNKQRIKSADNVARACDLVVCTTEYLATHYRDEVGCKDVYVYPNSVRPHCYPQVFLEKDPNEVRILWQGGNSHLCDWEPVMGAVGNVLRRYPQAKFVFWGQPFGAVRKNMPEDQYEEVPWGSYEAFYSRLATVNVDINFCPLVETPFNLAKSAIKWYEPSMLAQPPATVAANVGPYQEIKNGETGFLYDSPEELERCLGVLIEDAGLRQDLGHAARDWVMGHRHYMTTIVPYAEKLTEKLRARPMPLVEV